MTLNSMWMHSGSGANWMGRFKLGDAGYRLVYEVIEQRLVIVVMAVGRRDHDEVYWAASKRRNA